MKVVILLTEQLSLFELACASELFMLPRDEFDTWYTTQIVSLNCSQYEGLGGTMFCCEKVDCLPRADLLVIPSFPSSQTQISGQLREQILAHHAGGGRTISFCSGSFLLAELGLFDGKSATTHWRYAHLFRARFPKIDFKEDVLYLYDGQIGCSAGSAAGIDLGIEVIRQDFGQQHANTVARRMVLPAHRSGGQAQYVEKPLFTTTSHLLSTLDWAILNLSSKLSISDMAENANMSRRTFDRQFRKHYKITPLEWLTQQKISIAKSLLETSSQSIERIAEIAGFESAVTLRHNFRKHLSISPVAYRTQFNKQVTMIKSA